MAVGPAREEVTVVYGVSTKSVVEVVWETVVVSAAVELVQPRPRSGSVGNVSKGRADVGAAELETAGPESATNVGETLGPPVDPVVVSSAPL